MVSFISPDLDAVCLKTFDLCVGREQPSGCLVSCLSRSNQGVDPRTHTPILHQLSVSCKGWSGRPQVFGQSRTASRVGLQAE